jgi:hypothetical protein
MTMVGIRRRAGRGGAGIFHRPQLCRAKVKKELMDRLDGPTRRPTPRQRGGWPSASMAEIAGRAGGPPRPKA